MLLFQTQLFKIFEGLFVVVLFLRYAQKQHNNKFFLFYSRSWFIFRIAFSNPAVQNMVLLSESIMASNHPHISHCYYQIRFFLRFSLSFNDIAFTNRNLIYGEDISMFPL